MGKPQIKLKDILENKILVPRRSKEERDKNLAAIHYKQIQEFVKNGPHGNLDLEGTPLKTLPPNLLEVGGNLRLNNSQIKNLGNLQRVGNHLKLEDSSITSLGNLKRVEGSLDLDNTPITSLGNLEYVGMNLWLQGTPISKTHTEEQIREQVRVVLDIITDKSQF